MNIVGHTLEIIERNVEEGQYISFNEALKLEQIEDVECLLNAANRIRKKFKGNNVELCSIMNAKSGRCSENCKYCSQSVHYVTGIKEYPLVNADECLELARQNEASGVKRFSLVTSGKTVSEGDFENILQIFKVLKQKTKLELCASLGCISYDYAVKLKEAGLSMYHHNVETSSDYFDKICDTHSYQDRIDTIRNATAAKLNVCSGGIIGMGESMRQRIRMAFEIRELGVKSVPINILNPLKGTPMESVHKLEPIEIQKTIALFRFIIPDATIRIAGGRKNLGEHQWSGFKCGMDALMVGNYLTTTGAEINDDLENIRSLGLVI